MIRPVKVASKSLYETSAVSLFARLPTPTLLAARGFSTRRSSVTHAVTLIFPTDFRAKERLLAVYNCDRKGQSYPVEYYLELVEEYSEGKIHTCKCEPELGNGNVNTVSYVN